ncbi:MAG TPA: VOC family protein [Rhizomicrobium sp.]|jgi:predicted 3-demethylubiquinone-9 3-methyltransferase (glyoxalase superfamily)|nr:VOC family protein [Rhizomicrobium sp.]
MAIISKIAPCLWFDNQAEEAAKFYCSIFPNSKIDCISHYGKEGVESHRRPVGSVMFVAFTLDGQKFNGLNGGPQFKFSEAVSFMVYCKDQAEIDHYWSKLTEGGEPSVCGWLKDKFGLSWQIVSADLERMISSSDPARRDRVMKVVMEMRKPILADLQRAYEGP